MIPYFELRTLPIGGSFSLATFGVLVVMGVAAGIGFAQWRARVLDVPEEEINAAMAWALISGLLGSHLLAVFYDPGSPDRDLWSLFAFWNGMSAFGGFLGAFLGLAIHFGRKRKAWLVEADVLVQALVVGWVFGRLGCTLIHDHIGEPSKFLLAIQFPGGPRHDLGLYEFLYTAFVLVPAVFLLNRRTRSPGSTICVIASLYAPARFLGDFLRSTDLPGSDPRYLGLTAAQYGCITLAGIGLAIAWRLAPAWHSASVAPRERPRRSDRLRGACA
jgi:phosphatidylglycerol:prolipoprotein diacylglycerol transferase